jgi:hypothetical protein
MKPNWKYLFRDVGAVYLITFSSNVILAIQYDGKTPIKAFALTNIFCIVLSFIIVGFMNRKLKIGHIIQVILSCWLISLTNVVFFNMTWQTWLMSIIPLILLSDLGIVISRMLLPDKYIISVE